MPGIALGDVVILIHGIASDRFTMQPMAVRLSRAGFRPQCWTYPWRNAPLPSIVDRLGRALADLPLPASGRVHFVGHSMGGLVIRALLASSARPAALGRVVMLGTPNGGSPWVSLLDQWRVGRLLLGHSLPLLSPDRTEMTDALLGRIDYPLGIVAGDNARLTPFAPQIIPEPSDGRVAVTATHVEGAVEHLTLPVGHVDMLWSREVHTRTIAFLHSGCFYG